MLPLRRTKLLPIWRCIWPREVGRCWLVSYISITMATQATRKSSTVFGLSVKSIQGFWPTPATDLAGCIFLHTAAYFCRSCAGGSLATKGSCTRISCLQAQRTASLASNALVATGNRLRLKPRAAWGSGLLGSLQRDDCKAHFRFTRDLDD